MAPRFALAVILVADIAMSGMATQVVPKPTIAALFSNDSSGPAFWIECSNSSGQSMRRVGRWVQSYRLDGVEPPPSGSGGSGGPETIAPGDVWHGAFLFSNTKTKSEGADAAHTVSAVVTRGRHTIAVQCMGAWSDDISFFWNP